MRSKIITTVVGVLLVGPFVVLGYHDAVSIQQHLQEQHQKIRKLNTEAVRLDTELSNTKTVKEQSQQEIINLEQQTQAAINERQKLEAELGAN